MCNDKIREMAKKEITMQVDTHPSGVLFLRERIGAKSCFKDCAGPFFANSDPVDFYRAVARRIAKRAKEYEITYRDSSGPVPGK